MVSPLMSGRPVPKFGDPSYGSDVGAPETPNGTFTMPPPSTGGSTELGGDSYWQQPQTPYGGDQNGSFAGFDMSSLGRFLGLGPNGSSAFIPAMGMALQQWNQSHRYTDMAEHYADRLDPFGSQRPQYQDLLSESYKDPSKVLNDPAHLAELQHGMDATARTGASQGYLGSGNMAMALNDYARKDDAAWLQQYRQGLQPLTGAQFGPASAASILQTGMNGRLNAEQQALAAAFAPWSMDRATGGQGGPGIGGPGGSYNGNPFSRGPGQGGGGIPGVPSGMSPGDMQWWNSRPPGWGMTDNYGGDNTSIGPPGFDNTSSMNPMDPQQPWTDMNPIDQSNPWDMGGGGDMSGGWSDIGIAPGGGYDDIFQDPFSFDFGGWW